MTFLNFSSEAHTKMVIRNQGLENVWALVSNKIEFFKENYGGQFQLSGFLKGVLGRFSTEAGINDVRNFFEKVKFNEELTKNSD